MHSKRLWLMAAILVLCCVGYMTLGARASWSFILPFRGTKLLAMLLVGIAVSTATVLFQSIVNNRILTPSIMGFDTLYVLVLTLGVFFLGGFGVADLPPWIRFLTSGTVMVIGSVALFSALLLDPRQDLMRMILTGVIFGTLFRSGTSFLQRLIDPSEFLVVQVQSFARFNAIETELLGISAIITLITLAFTWRMRHRLDILSLGRHAAINLGETPRTAYLQVLLLTSILVSVSTALVGPIAFLGLLVVALAHTITPSPHHRVLLPSAALISMITLVGGQMILERVLQLATPLSVVIDLLGGAIFLILILKSLRK